MAGSTLTGFNYIPENSEATPGLWNSVFSVLSQNIAEANSSTISSNISTLGMVTINADSTVTNYILFNDTSNQRSDYIIGSQVGGTADGLNIYDASGQTMIVSFSKQSVRFFQNIVGPVFDTGGALTNTLNAATFGTGSQSVESRIQAAISAASLGGISRVYVPAAMYPYSGASISFDTRVQMVREGGDWTVFDIVAYGANGNGSTASAAANSAAIQSAISGANADPLGSGLAGGVVYIPPGRYVHDQTIRIPVALNSGQVIVRGAGMRVSNLYPQGSAITGILMGSAAPDHSGAFVQQTQYCGLEDIHIVGSLVTITNGVAIQMTEMQKGWMRNVAIESYNVGSGIGLYLTGSLTTSGGPGASAGPHNWRCGFQNVVVFTTIQPLVMVNCDENDFYNCNFGIQPGLTSAVTGIWIQQGRNNRFFGLLIPGDSSSITTGRPNYTGLLLTAPANGDNGANQFYGIVTEGHNSGVSIASGVYNTAIYNHDSSINLQGLTDSGTATFYSETALLTVPLFQYPDGSSAGPAFAFRSENSLGWYRSARSTMALSNSGRLTVGSAVAFSLLTQPEYAFGAEPTLGLLRSGASQMDFYANGLFLARHAATGGTAWFGVPDGSATTPAIQFPSETSLGLYRSGTSAIGLSYGQFQVPAGTATLPAVAWSSESSLGFYRSLVSVVAVTYGQFAGPSGGVVTRPSLTINSDKSMGIWDAGSNILGFTTKGAAVAYMYPAQFNWSIDGTSLLPVNAYFSERSLGFYRSGASTIAVSQGTFNLATNAIRFSMRTLAASAVTVSAAKTNVAVNEVVFTVGGASGASLCIYSGGSVYIFNSALSAAAS